MTKPVAKAAMLIRRPVAVVFDAFVDPGTITKFWLESTTGPLAKGARVEWRFMVPGATETATVTRFDKNEHIAFRWSGGVTVDMKFVGRGSNATRLDVDVSGFGDEAIEGVVNATEGFSIVLCDL